VSSLYSLFPARLDNLNTFYTPVVYPYTIVSVTGVQANTYLGQVQVWGLVPDNQTANWTNVSHLQSPNWATVGDTQTAGWQNVSDTQTPLWIGVGDTQTAGWQEVVT